MNEKPIILLVDDEKDFRELASIELEQQGFSIAEAANGEEAIQKAESLNPDVILLDIRMPNVNGLEVLRRLRDNPATKGLKVIFLTNVVDPWPFAKEMGVEKTINKSEGLQSAVAEIKRVLGT